MIQRIQTLFLLIVAALAVVLFYLPVFDIKTTDASMHISDVFYMIRSNALISVIVAMSGILALVAIFLYRNRKRQMMLCRLNLLFITGAIGLILQASDMSGLPQSAEHVSVQYFNAVYLPIVQMVFNLLAMRFIKKDDELVRSADRLR